MINHRFRAWLAACLAVLPSLHACIPAPTEPAAAASLTAGDTLPVYLFADGQEVYNLTYTLMDLDEAPQPGASVAGEASSPVPVLTAATYTQADYPALQQPVDPEDVRAFVREWNATFGDDGFTAKDLLKQLADSGADVALYLSLYRESRLSLDDYVDLLGIIQASFTPTGGSNPVLDVAEGLRWHGVGLGQLVAALTEASGAGTPAATGRLSLPAETARAFFLALARDSRSMAMFLQGRHNDQPLAGAVRQLLGVSMAVQAPAPDLLDSVSARGGFHYRRTWSVAENDRVALEETAITSDKQKDPATLTDCKPLEIKERRLVVGLASAPLVDYRWHWVGEVSCTAPNDRSLRNLVKSLAVNVTQTKRSWLWGADMDASLSADRLDAYTAQYYAMRYNLPVQTIWDYDMPLAKLTVRLRAGLGSNRSVVVTDTASLVGQDWL